MQFHSTGSVSGKLSAFEEEAQFSQKYDEVALVVHFQNNFLESQCYLFSTDVEHSEKRLILYRTIKVPKYYYYFIIFCVGL